MRYPRGLKWWLSGSTAPRVKYLAGFDTRYTPNAPPTATTTTGFTVAKTASGSYCPITASTISSNFTTTVKPTGNPWSASGDGWLMGPLIGTFSPGTWSVSLVEIAGTNVGSGSFNLVLWKGSIDSGSNATSFTPMIRTSFQATNTTLNETTSQSFNVSSSVTFNNEYLFLQGAWGISLAAGSNGSSVTFVQGSSSFLSSSVYEDNTFIIWDHDDNPGLM